MMYAKDFRASARAALKGKWVMAMIIGFIAALLGANTLAYSSGSHFSSDSFETGFNAGFEAGSNGYDIDMEQLEQELAYAFTNNPIVGILGVAGVAFVMVIVILVILIQLIVGGAMTIGYRRYHLALMDAEEADFNVAFSGFEMFGKAFIWNLLQGLYLLGWSLLFVIPGIVKSYSYAMSGYILAENPEMDANDAITASRMMMDGNKWRLFCLDFSFIGWTLLASLTFGIGNIALEPYMASSHAAFYREISQTWKGEVDYEDSYHTGSQYAEDPDFLK